jgi:3-phenylpropionate/cinnamic acid dioxygenase small subunit
MSIAPKIDGRTPIPSGEPVYASVVDFLYEEAALLDDRDHRGWLDRVAPDIQYVVPVRITSPHTLADSTLDDMAHFDEDLYSLEKRVERLETEHAWAEDPPSRTRRFVTNIRCWEGDAADEIVVRSNLLVFRSRGDLLGPDLLSGQRTDLLRRTDDGLRLARREVLLDESVLRTQNLAIFL